MGTTIASTNLPTDVVATPRGVCPRWLHALAVLTVVAALPLLFLGAEVTTKGVGMADQRPVVNPLQAFLEMVTGQQSLGWVIEHSHRLAGWLVGLLVTVLAAAFWVAAPRFRWVGLLAWFMVAVQGSLGIFRVALNDWLGPSLAFVHGCFAQLVFATLTGAALVTSRAWHAPAAPCSAMLRRGALAVVAVLFVQLVLGGMLRHQGTLLAARGHLLGAFVGVAGLAWLVKIAWRDVLLRRAAGVIVGLLTLQVVLGVEAWMFWMRRAYLPLAGAEESAAVHWLRSGHYLVGALLFASAVVLMLLANRQPAPVGEEAVS